MKWFKHISKSRHDAKIMRLIRRHGLRGYGLYFAILENIAFDLEPDKPIPELEETAQDIAEFFGDDTLKVQEIVDDCVKEGLFEVHPDTKRIMCLKLLAYLDNTLSQNQQIKSILSRFKSLKLTSSDLKQIRLDYPTTAAVDLKTIKATESESETATEPFVKLFKLFENRWATMPNPSYREQANTIFNRVQPTDDELIDIINRKNRFDWVLEAINSLEKIRKAKPKQTTSPEEADLHGPRRADVPGEEEKTFRKSPEELRKLWGISE